MQEALRREGATLVEIEGQGNCVFQATLVAAGLGRAATDHLQLRKQVADLHAHLNHRLERDQRNLLGGLDEDSAVILTRALSTDIGLIKKKDQEVDVTVAALAAMVVGLPTVELWTLEPATLGGAEGGRFERQLRFTTPSARWLYKNARMLTNDTNPFRKGQGSKWGGVLGLTEKSAHVDVIQLKDRVPSRCRPPGRGQSSISDYAEPTPREGR